MGRHVGLHFTSWELLNLGIVNIINVKSKNWIIGICVYITYTTIWTPSYSILISDVVGSLPLMVVFLKVWLSKTTIDFYFRFKRILL